MQRRVLLDAFAALHTMTAPGSLLELPYKWQEPA
jgi:hypothetical protein